MNDRQRNSLGLLEVLTLSQWNVKENQCEKHKEPEGERNVHVRVLLKYLQNFALIEISPRQNFIIWSYDAQLRIECSWLPSVAFPMKALTFNLSGQFFYLRYVSKMHVSTNVIYSSITPSFEVVLKTVDCCHTKDLDFTIKNLIRPWRNTAAMSWRKSSV